MTKILIIEDNSVLLDSIADFLTEEGFQIVKALNGEEGVEMAIRHVPDIILSDIYMPKLNGYEVFDALRKTPSTSLIPFIFISAKAEKEDILFGLRLGADDYIIKPIDFPELLKRILTRIEKNQNTIRLSEVKYQALFESANDAILMVRVAGEQIVDANPTACTLLQFEKEALLAMNTRELFQPLDRETSLQFFDEQEGWKDHFLSEAKWITADRKTLPVQVSGRRIRLVGEDFIFLIVRDISLQREYQQQLILSKEKAEESDRLKSSILANMSHELRTPLNGILGFAEILKEELGSGELVVMAENIRNSGKWLLNTLDSVLTLSQLEAGKIKPKAERGDLVPLIREVAESFWPRAAEKGIGIETDLPDSLVFTTDHKLIRQIVAQLTDNAIKFTNAGSITIRAEAPSMPAGDLLLMVRDSGIGIPAQNIEMIFQEFRQVSEGLGRQFQGAGLGLTITRKIVGLFGGTIHLESEPGKGSVFTVSIPGDPSRYPRSPVADSPATTKTDVISGKGLLPRILLVEDNLLNRELTAYFLRNLCILDQVSRGEEAIRMAGIKKYDAILMDINLGQGIDGLQATRSIRTLPGYANIPVIALTGYTFEEDLENLRACGCSSHLSKPYDRAGLLNSIASVLGKERSG